MVQLIVPKIIRKCIIMSEENISQKFIFKNIN